MTHAAWLLLLMFACLTGCATTPTAPVKRIAITFDDVPRARGAFFTPDERTAKLIAALKQARVRQAAFFVTPGYLDTTDGAGGEARIAAYAAAGHVLANHSFGHRALSAVPAADYIADIDRAEAWLKDRKNRRAWFRFPYLNEGRTDKAKRDAVRAALAARGLRNGYVTVDAYDWNFDALTTKAVRAGKPVNMPALRDLFVGLTVEAAEFNDDLARRTIGRSPAHVLLLHETDLVAMFMPDLVAALRKAGWTIVTADEAFADPLGREMPDVPSAQGTLTEALAWQKGIPAPRWHERSTPRVADPLFAARVLGEAPLAPQ
ncbi:MAG TPA: polysaccharide deacetylase family protein [Sphingomonadaceae bacterium]|nr:polysaccharide deacetylase family protein [Sphingomonadaceae bacterium]